ncbi:MAG: DNA-directed RNA polymerase subunit P [Candidatus Micrarchaeaceae archaeon]
MAYVCAYCGKKIKTLDNFVRCTYCGYRILIKGRPNLAREITTD